MSIAVIWPLFVIARWPFFNSTRFSRRSNVPDLLYLSTPGPSSLGVSWSPIRTPQSNPITHNRCELVCAPCIASPLNVSVSLPDHLMFRLFCSNSRSSRSPPLRLLLCYLIYSPIVPFPDCVMHGLSCNPPSYTRSFLALQFDCPPATSEVPNDCLKQRSL